MELFQRNWIVNFSNNIILQHFFSRDVCVYIACQFALESNFGDSDLAIKHFNYCGMKVPHRRANKSIDNTHTFARYSSFNDCVVDYILWVFYNRPYQPALEHVGSFRLFLRDSGYCPEKDYLSKIDNIYNQFINFKS